MTKKKLTLHEKIFTYVKAHSGISIFDALNELDLPNVKEDAKRCAILKSKIKFDRKEGYNFGV